MLTEVFHLDHSLTGKSQEFEMTVKCFSLSGDIEKSGKFIILLCPSGEIFGKTVFAIWSQIYRRLREKYQISKIFQFGSEKLGKTLKNVENPKSASCATNHFWCRERFREKLLMPKSPP
jgi:hypothetical protein